jgi:hypothetical protein
MRKKGESNVNFAGEPAIARCNNDFTSGGESQTIWRNGSRIALSSGGSGSLATRAAKDGTSLHAA